jgi:phosphate transport system substrate-binding protein
MFDTSGIVFRRMVLLGLAILGVLTLSATACSSGGGDATAVPASQPTVALPAATLAPAPTATPAPTPAIKLKGNIEIDGSSTVFPISQAVAEEFRKTNPAVQVPVGISGTGGGFKRFSAGETDISDASRPIKQTEVDAAAKNGVEYIELAVAYDGLSILVNKSNSFVTCVTTAELKKIWEPGSKVAKWNDVRPEWPADPIRLYGPGTDSGTFDYFTEAINGKEDASRADYTASEDDNVLVQGIAGDKNSLGYFGFAYYNENKDKLKLVAVDSGNGCVLPSEQTINDGTYKPLSRPLFIYVKKKSLERPEVKAFVTFYLENAAALSAEVGYVPLPAKDYQSQLASIK